MKNHQHRKAFEIVEAGYDRIGERYTEERGKFDIRNELKEFCSKLPPNGKVLDAGCGTGIPVGRHLIRNGFEVVGIDISKTMVATARRNLPEAMILQMNMVDINFPPESFDGLISCYALIHVPRERHAGIFQSFHTILKDQGAILAVSYTHLTLPTN